MDNSGPLEKWLGQGCQYKCEMCVAGNDGNTIFGDSLSFNDHVQKEHNVIPPVYKKVG